MSYGERAFFEGDHCAHCALRESLLIDAARLYVKGRAAMRAGRQTRPR